MVARYESALASRRSGALEEGIDHDLVRTVARWEQKDAATSTAGDNVFAMMRRIGKAKADLAADYARWMNEPAVRCGLNQMGIATPQSQEKWVEENLERGAKSEPEVVEFTVYDRKDSAPVGTAGLLGILAPATAAGSWGTFVAPRAKVPVAAPARVGIELVLYGAAAAGLAAAGQPVAAVVLGVAGLVTSLLNEVQERQAGAGVRR